MFDKIVKKIFLTKETREALEARNRRAAKQAEPAVAQPPATLDQELARAAKDAGEAEAAGDLRDTANATSLERETIREAIASAHRELVEQDGSAVPGEVPRSAAQGAVQAGNHEELVKSAMLIYRQKQKVLADLDPTARKKLRLMARTVFGAQMKE